MPERIIYQYFLSCSLRPAFRKPRTDRKILNLSSDADFELWATAINARFEFQVLVHTAKGWLSKSPLLSTNLGTPIRAMNLVQPLLLPKASRITFVIENNLAHTRKWNRIEIALFGYKVIEAEVHESPVTDHESRL